MRSPLLATLLVGTAALAGGCSEDEVGQLRGDLTTLELIDFGDVQIGILLPFELEVKNQGTGVVSVQGVDLAPNFAGTTHEFKLSETSFTLGPNTSRRMVVSFRPLVAMEAPIESSFTFRTSATDESGVQKTFTVRVQGRGIQTGLIVEPLPVDFGTVLVGASRTLDVKITNALSLPVDVRTKVTSSGEAEIFNQGGLGSFRILSAVQKDTGSLLPAGQLLQPNTSVTVQAMFVPHPDTQEGLTDRGRWVISNCPDTLCELPVQMLGKGTNAALSCAPPIVDFGDRNPGSTSTLEAECSNAASEAVIITGWRLDSASAPAYSVPSYGGTPSTLEPGASFRVPVHFSPLVSSVGSDILGTLEITGRNPRADRNLNPTRVALKGRAGGPDIDVTPAEVNFGRVAIGGTAKRRVLISNTGYSNLTVTDITKESDPAGLFALNRTAAVVPAGGGEVIEVTFAPVAEGEMTARIMVKSNDTDEPEVTVQLRGTGADLPPCSFSVAPTMVTFGIVPVLRATTQGVRITNTGTEQCFVNTLEIAPGSSSAFTLLEGPQAELVLQPGEEKAVIIEFLPPREGVEEGLLTFYISSPGASTVEIPLRGVGSTSALMITPNELDFGNIRLGCASRERAVTVYNTGSQPTRLTSIEVPNGVSSEFQVVSLPSGLPMPPGSGASIAAGQSTEFRVRYVGHDSGVDTGFVQVMEAGRTDPYVVPLYGAAAVDATNEDRFTQLETPAVDILFVIDNSGSMSEEQASLASNFASFIRFADDQALDYRIAVVSTDVDGSGDCPRPLVDMRPAGLEQAACGYFADGSAEGVRDPAWRLVTPDEQPSPAAAFASLITQGTSGSASEKGLQAAYQALSAPIANGWNAGFLRPEAYLAVIFISDEEDQSLPMPVDFFVNFFKSIKGFRNTHLFSASAIVGDPPDGCATSDGAGERYVAVASQTGGVFESICTPSWSSSLENLGLSVFGYKSRFLLSNQPAAGTIEVYVDGVRVEQRANSGQERWTYDPATNSVNFAPLAIPEPGSQISVRYQAECL